MDKLDELLVEVRVIRESQVNTHLELVKEQAAIKSELVAFRASQAEICKAACAQRAEHAQVLFAKPEGIVAQLQSVRDKVTLIWIGFGVAGAALIGYGIEKFVER